MYPHYILTAILLLALPQFYQLKSIPKDVYDDQGYNFTEFDEVYDQKQKGSYNVRVGIDGVNVLMQTDIKYSPDWIEANLISLALMFPWPGPTEKPTTPEDFFDTSTVPIELGKNEDKMGDLYTNETTEAVVTEGAGIDVSS